MLVGIDADIMILIFRAFPSQSYILFVYRSMGQNIRRLLQFGIPGLEHPQVEPFFHGLLHRMANVLAALEQHSRHHQIKAAEAQGASVGVVVTVGDGQNGLVEELQELSERMAGAAVDAQKEHPLGFRRFARTICYAIRYCRVNSMCLV